MKIAVLVPSELNITNELKEIEDNVDIIQISSNEELENTTSIKNEYNIVNCGGAILYNGEKLENYEQYIKDNLKDFDIKVVALDLQCMYHTLDNCQLIDKKVIKIGIDNLQKCEEELHEIANRYEDFNFFIQNKNIYAVPCMIDKAIAMRWLEHRNRYDKKIVVGSEESDLNAMFIADYAIVSKESTILKNKIVQDGIIVNTNKEISNKIIEIVNTLLEKGE